MLSKKQRIHSQEYKNIQKKGKYKYNNMFQLCYLAKDIKENNSFAVSISKKITKKAVHRNFLRRKIYDFIQKKYPQFPKTYYYIISLRKKPENQEILEQQLLNIFTQIKK